MQSLQLPLHPCNETPSAKLLVKESLNDSWLLHPQNMASAGAQRLQRLRFILSRHHPPKPKQTVSTGPRWMILSPQRHACRLARFIFLRCHLPRYLEVKILAKCPAKCHFFVMSNSARKQRTSIFCLVLELNFDSMVTKVPRYPSAARSTLCVRLCDYITHCDSKQIDMPITTPSTQFSSWSCNSGRIWLRSATTPMDSKMTHTCSQSLLKGSRN